MGEVVGGSCAMSVFLDEYLRLEQEMLRLDAIAGGEAEADELRDFMDVVWRRLSGQQRAQLNTRPVVAPVSRPRLSVQVGSGFITTRPTAAAREPARAKQLTLADNEIWCAR